MKTVGLLIAVCLLGACNKLGMGSSDSDPAGQCASSNVQSSVLSAIADHMAPRKGLGSDLVDRDKLAKLVQFKRPTVDAVDHDAATITCSADLVVLATGSAQFTEISTSLERVPGDNPTVRLRYLVKKQADTGAPVYDVKQVDEVAMFLTKAYLGSVASQARRTDAPPPEAGAPTPPADLLAREEKENDQCRGGDGGVETMRACNRRQTALEALQEAGWCWGGADIEADKRFVQCSPGDKDYDPGAFDKPYYSEDEMREAAQPAEQNSADAP